MFAYIGVPTRLKEHGTYVFFSGQNIRKQKHVTRRLLISVVRLYSVHIHYLYTRVEEMRAVN